MDDHSKLSRRSILKEAALVAGATLAATLFPSNRPRHLPDVAALGRRWQITRARLC